MRETESQLAIRRNPQKRNCKLSDPQVPKACKFKIRLAPKIDSRSMAWTMFTDDQLQKPRTACVRCYAGYTLPLREEVATHERGGRLGPLFELRISDFWHV